MSDHARVFGKMAHPKSLWKKSLNHPRVSSQCAAGYHASHKCVASLELVVAWVNESQLRRITRAIVLGQGPQPLFACIHFYPSYFLPKPPSSGVLQCRNESTENVLPRHLLVTSFNIQIK